MDGERLKRGRIVIDDISGENLKARGIVVNEDRISELPDDLLQKILSLLSAKDVTATSILSKRYRSLWNMVPKLNFESQNKNVKSFLKNVGRFLLSHEAPVLESLNLQAFYKCDALDVGICIGIALTRHVRELDLFVAFKEPVRFPSSLLISNTLETLKLNCSFLVDVSSTVCMNSLRTLHLKYHVRYKDDESVGNLLSGCPNLENLLVHRRHKNKDMVNFNIIVPSLKTLSIQDSSNVQQQNGGYVINTPCLKFLNIKRLNGSSKFCLTENLSELVEADINISDIASENILGSLKSVKRLILALPPLKIAYPTGLIFSQLVYLEIDTQRGVWWNLLMLILDSSPKLHVLKLIDENLCSNESFRIGGKWNETKYVPECLLFHLETFVWKGYDWEREENKEVATYILRNAEQLKKATFSPNSIRSKKLKKLKERCKLIKDFLDGIVMASDSCQIIVSE